jgi:hypothetical protein
MRRLFLRSLMSAAVWTLLLGVCGEVRAGPLWYNGNFDGNNAYLNLTPSPFNPQPDGAIYENFIVPTGNKWTINTVFSNNFVSDIAPGIPLTESATWSILSGVSAGNGGSVIASGDNFASVTLTGNTLGSMNEYNVAVTGLNITLGPGMYWLSVAPDDTFSNGGYFMSFISTTSGAGAVGMPPGNDGNSFFNSAFYGNNFTPTDDPSVLGPNPNNSAGWDFSMGVNGTTVVPEPSSLALLVVGLVCVGGRTVLSIRSRRRKAVA